MKAPKNLRTMKISSGSGTNVKQTSQLSGEATPTAAFKSKNETTEYETGGSMGPGEKGGKNAGL